MADAGGRSGGRPRLFLVDAYALVYRSYFAFARRPLTNSAGENTSAPFGFTGFLRDLLRDHDPEYVAVVFDAGVSFRDEIYPEYKATRDRMPDDLRASLGHVRAIVRGLSLAVVELEGYEADDVIGTLARKAVEAGIDSVIVSSDKDFLQLVAPGVKIMNPGRGGPGAVAAGLLDEEAAERKFGVAPAKIVDYLALVGDPSDNVPGAPGIGPKTAAKLLASYSGLDEIVARSEEIRPVRFARIVREHREQIRLSKELVTIKRDLDVELDLERLEVGEPDAAALYELFSRLEFLQLRDEFAEQARGGKKGSAAEPVAPTEIVTDPAEFQRIAVAVAEAGMVAIHTESADGRLVGLALAVEGAGPWYLPFGHLRPLALDAGLMDEEGPANLPQPGREPMAALRELLEGDGTEKVAHDIKRHALALDRAGVRLGGDWFDVSIASYLLEPGRRDREAHQLAHAEFGEKHATADGLRGRGKSRRSLAELAVSELAELCGGYARISLRLATRYRRRLAREGLTRLMTDLEMPLVPILMRMEKIGIGLDLDFFGEMRRRIVLDLEKLRNQVHLLAGGPFNMNSTPQLRRILFGEQGLPVLKKTKTGPSTDASVLEELAALGHELPQRMMEYRELEKLRSTYVEALPALVDSETGRLHTSFNQTVAATGRLSSSNPNLQNIPIRTEVGREIRHGFVADPGHVFLSADYSQIELRVLAHLSGDEAFSAAFREGIDIHRQTASVLFGVGLDGVTPAMRDRAKSVNFATLYGQGAFSLGRQLGIPRNEAQAFITAYFEKLSGIREYLDEQVERAMRDGCVETLMGRRRTVPELRSPNWHVREGGKRIALNTPIQGSAADLMKKAMIDVRRALDAAGTEAKILLQVHDELLLEAPEDAQDDVLALVVDTMENVAELRVPLVVDSGTGRDWYGCKG